MAKIAPAILHWQGNMGEYNFVKRGKGFYVRRKRGTVKKAVLNEKLQSVIDRNKLINRTAVPVNSILKEYAGIIREGSSWQRILKCLRKCKDDNPETHLQSLANLELNLLHQMMRHTDFNPYTITVHKDHFIVGLKFRRHAAFRNKNNNSYYYDIIALLWDKKMEITEHDSISTHWVYDRDEVPEYELKFKRTKWDKYYLLALKLKGGENGKSIGGKADMAMIILGGGKLD